MFQKIGYQRVFRKTGNSKRLSRKNLLENVFQPRKALLSQQLNCCFRSFNFKLWTKRYPLLVFYRSKDHVFCLSCVLLATSSTSLFNNLPCFSKWNKTREKTEEHSNTSTHKESTSQLEDLKAWFSNADLNVPFSFDNERQQRIEKNTKIFRWVIEVIITCGRQCLPPRAYRKKTPDTNSRIFFTILRLLGKANQTLKENWENPIAWNAQYLLLHIQNEIIDIIAYGILQRDLIDEVKTAKCFTILADKLRVIMLNDFPFVWHMVINRMIYARSS